MKGRDLAVLLQYLLYYYYYLLLLKKRTHTHSHTGYQTQ